MPDLKKRNMCYIDIDILFILMLLFDFGQVRVPIMKLLYGSSFIRIIWKRNVGGAYGHSCRFYVKFLSR